MRVCVSKDIFKFDGLAEVAVIETKGGGAVGTIRCQVYSPVQASACLNIRTIK
jgi:hypothetical protein